MTAVHRVEVRPRPGIPDPRGEAVRRDAEALGLPRAPSRVEVANVYLIQGDLTDAQVRRLIDGLLADPVSEAATVGAALPRGDALIEIHPLPGVMDPDAEAVESAIRAMLGVSAAVRTARRFDLYDVDPALARRIAQESLANPVIHAIHDQPYRPEAFPGGGRFRFKPTYLVIEDMDDRALARLARDAHLFLSVPEMKVIQAEYRRLKRDPAEIELETIAQTWSEHCVHKTFKSKIALSLADGDPMLRGLSPAQWAASRPGHQAAPGGAITIDNLLRSTVMAATQRLISEGLDWCLSVFADNSGVIAFDGEHAVCFKVETHNHPSAIEPYGGAATGIGGCIRDIMGTGQGARPVASTDVFCVALPGLPSLPGGCLHPRRILTQVVAGVRDYGNRMGIPTINGAVWFDDDYVGNPLVFCGCVGVMPRDRVRGEARAGDRIVVLGGRTGRDGIHGATFSSSELTGTHADEFSHAVQIGNAVTQKKVLEAIMEARDASGGGGCLYNAITDCGAGGFSSAVGEMGRTLGAEVNLDKAPLKYSGLSPTEIWISEAQERMVLAVPEQSLEALRAICAVHEVEMCELGRFGTEGRRLILRYARRDVGSLSMDFLHEGLPLPLREASWDHRRAAPLRGPAPPGPRSLNEALLALLAHPNIASKRWIIRQYDHEVQGGSVVKPLVGPRGEGPSDAAVILPVSGSTRGLAIACGLATGLRRDPYPMALAAIDECVRNLVCVGADPDRIALLDNFCWPGCNDPERLGELVRAAEGCYDGAIAYRAPFISGKDSLNNQFTDVRGRTIEIPPTLLISGLGIVPDAARCVTMDAKGAGGLLVLAGMPARGAMGGSHYARTYGVADGGEFSGESWSARRTLEEAPAAARGVASAIALGLVRAAHDVSDGGLLVAAAEMSIAGELGLDLDLKEISIKGQRLEACCFSEEPGRYLLEVAPGNLNAVRAALGSVPLAVVGRFSGSARLKLAEAGLDAAIRDLAAAWTRTLDW